MAMTRSLDRIGADHVIPGTPDHGGQEEDAHAYLNKSAIEAQHQKNGDGEQVIGPLAYSACPGSSVRPTRDDQEHEDQQVAEDGMELPLLTCRAVHRGWHRER